MLTPRPTLAGRAPGRLPNVNQISGVEFYRSASSEIDSLADATYMGSATYNGSGNWTYNVERADSGFALTESPETFFAVATDVNGQVSAANWETLSPVYDSGVWTGELYLDPFATTAFDANPIVGDLAATPLALSNAPTTSMLQLTASDVTGADGGLAASVTFYMAPTGNSSSSSNELGTVTGGNGTNNWTLDVDVTSLTGSYTIYAQAIGANGERSVLKTTTVDFNRPAVLDFAADVSTDSGGIPRLTLWTDDLSAGDSASSTSVKYYVDTSGIGPFDSSGGEYELLGTVTSGDRWRLGVDRYRREQVQRLRDVLCRGDE